MEGAGVVSKPTGANKRKGANPVRQIISDGGGGGPLDLTTPDLNKSRKVILTVPQYKLVSSSSMSSSVASPELSVTPVVKKESSSDNEEEDYHSDIATNNNLALHSLLSSQPHSLFSLEQLKQASLIFQKHTLNGNTIPGFVDTLAARLLTGWPRFQIKQTV